MRRRLLVSVLFLVTLLRTSPALAADPHAYIPADARVLVLVRAQTLLDAPLVDREKPITLRDIIKRDHKDPVILGVKPLENIDRALIALPTVGEVKKVFAVFEGRFDAEAVRKALTERFGDQLKEHGKGAEAYFQFPIAEQKFRGITTPGTVFLAIPDKNTLLLSLGDEDSLVAALARRGTGTPAALRQQLDKTNRDLAVACVFENQLGGPLAERKDARRAFELFQWVAGGIRIDEEGSGQFTMTCSDNKAASELEGLVRKGLNLVTGAVALVSQVNRDLKPVLEVLRTCRVSTKGKQVNLRGKMERDVLAELIKQK